MHRRFRRAAAGAVAAGLLAVIAGGAQSALAASRGVLAIPCSAPALTAAISGATSGETLSLATLCRYELTAPLPPVLGNLTIQGNHATIERSQAAGTPEFTILTVGGPPAYASKSVRIASLNLSNGAPGIFVDSGSLSVSGGLFSGNSTAISTTFYTKLSVAGATFTGNTGKYGGAISAGYDATLSDSTFTGNSAQQGGAVYVQYGKQAITRCRFAGNTATYGGGGLYDDGDVTMTGTTFTSNHASVGGAVSIFDPIFASLAVTRSAFIANSARTGGAVYNYDGLTVTGSTFTANRAVQGGAVDQDWYATLTSDLFTRNTATASGGGMFAGYNTVVDGTTFTRNTADSDGGAIDNGLGSLGFAGPLTVAGSSITGNFAGTDGGGIFNDSAERATAGLSSTVLGGNEPDNCAPPGAVSGCAALARAPGGRDGSGAMPPRSMPRHHGGHLPRLLLRELTGR